MELGKLSHRGTLKLSLISAPKLVEARNKLSTYYPDTGPLRVNYTSNLKINSLPAAR
jgi:hypothetical protein